MKGLNIKYRKGKVSVEISLQIRAVRYIDHVIEIAPIVMEVGDSIDVTYKVDVVGFTNDLETSRLPFATEAHFEIAAKMLVQFIRFRGLDGVNRITIHEAFPEGISL